MPLGHARHVQPWLLGPEPTDVAVAGEYLAASRSALDFLSGERSELTYAESLGAVVCQLRSSVLSGTSW